MRNPKTIDEFRQWCQENIERLEQALRDSEPELHEPARICNRAKTIAYELSAYNLADELPWRDLKSPVDCLLRLRECIDWIDSGGPTKPIGDGPYTVAQVARILGVSETHVYDLCREGAICCQRHGNAIRITREQLEAYERQSQRQPMRTGFRHF